MKEPESVLDRAVCPSRWTAEAQLWLDPEWRVLRANRRAETVLRVPVGQLLNRSIWDLWPELPADELKERFANLASEMAGSLEFHCPVAEAWFRLHIHTSTDGICALFQDISEEKRKQAELSASESRNRTLLQSIPQLIWTANAAGDLSYCNDEFARYTGRNVDQILGLDSRDLIHPDDLDRCLEGLPICIDRQSVHTVEQRLRGGDGTYRWFLTRGVPLLDEQGSLVEWLGCSVDIDDLKRTESALEESQARLKAMFDNSQEAVFLADDRALLVDANPAACSMLGMSQDDLLGMPVWEISTPAMKELTPALWTEFLVKGRQSGEYQLAGPGGEAVHVEYNAVASILPGIHLFVMRNTADRKQATDATQRYRLLKDFTSDLITFMSQDGNLLDVNEAVVKALGYSREELLQMHTLDFRVEGARAEPDVPFCGGNARTFTTTRVRKDGSTFPVEFNLQAVEMAGETVFVGVGRDLTERLRWEEERRELARRLVTAQEDERRRIARELHDEMGQYIAALSLGVQAMEPALRDSPPYHAQLIRLRQIIQRIGQDVHRIASELRPAALDDLGFEPALRNHLEEWSRTYKCSADVHCHGLVGCALPDEVETALYRVAQEGLTNIVKHARATSISVIVDRRLSSVDLIIEDNGVGFDPEMLAGSREPRGHFGLIGARERVSLLGGTLTIESGHDRGTTLFVRIPLEDVLEGTVHG